ncbi:unnamed protein product [Phaeothamnion confervicola]
MVAKTILRRQLQETGHYPDFVFCVGDDISDENMFTSVYSFLADVDSIPPDGKDAHLRAEADNIRLYMCTVGKKPTHATYYVDETSEVEDLVVALADATDAYPAAAKPAAAAPAVAAGTTAVTAEA